MRAYVLDCVLFTLPVDYYEVILAVHVSDGTARVTFLVLGPTEAYILSNMQEPSCFYPVSQSPTLVSNKLIRAVD